MHADELLRRPEILFIHGSPQRLGAERIDRRIPAREVVLELNPFKGGRNTFFKEWRQTPFKVARDKLMPPFVRGNGRRAVQPKQIRDKSIPQRIPAAPDLNVDYRIPSRVFPREVVELLPVPKDETIHRLVRQRDP